MKKVVITGITGFLGSHLARKCIASGYSVIGVKRKKSDLHRLKDISSQIRYINIENGALVEQFEGIMPSAILHTACIYGRKNEKASEVLDTNVSVSLQILEAAIKAKVGCFINADTALPRDIDTYSLSKYQFKQWGKHLKDQIKFINMRIELMYGVGDNDDKFVQWFVNQLHQQIENIPLTAGDQIRDFIYVDDVAAAFISVLKNINNLPAFTNFDVTTGRPVTVRKFLQRIVKEYTRLYSEPKSILCFGAISSCQTNIVSREVSPYALEQFGWRPKVCHKDGILKVLEDLQ